MPRSFVISLSFLLLISGCSDPATPALGPLQYRHQFAGNVSTLFGQLGTERISLNDHYAPDFHWMRADSTLDSLTGHLGQVVMINFWATWCAPCRAEMPEIENLVRDMGDSLFVIGVSVDYPGDPFPTVQQYAHDHAVTYQIVVDSAWRLYQRYELWTTNVLPVTMIVDADGVLQEDALEGSQTEAVFRRVINKYR